jgi:DNA-binding protein HU-beta
MATIKDIAGYVAANNGISKKASEEIVKDVFAYIRDEVSGGNDVRVNDFGVFKLKETAARTGRNPATGKEIHIPESNKVKFKP